MLIRVFKVRIKTGCHEQWQTKVEEFSIPWLVAQSGLVAYFPGKPLDTDSCEFSMISIWENIDALKKAVGDNWQKVVLLEDEASLVEEATVEHFEYFDRKSENANSDM